MSGLAWTLLTSDYIMHFWEALHILELWTAFVLRNAQTAVNLNRGCLLNLNRGPTRKYSPKASGFKLFVALYCCFTERQIRTHTQGASFIVNQKGKRLAKKDKRLEVAYTSALKGVMVPWEKALPILCIQHIHGLILLVQWHFHAILCYMKALV